MMSLILCRVFRIRRKICSHSRLMGRSNERPFRRTGNRGQRYCTGGASHYFASLRMGGLVYFDAEAGFLGVVSIFDRRLFPEDINGPVDRHHFCISIVIRESLIAFPEYRFDSSIVRVATLHDFCSGFVRGSDFFRGSFRF